MCSIVRMPNHDTVCHQLREGAARGPSRKSYLIGQFRRCEGDESGLPGEELDHAPPDLGDAVER